MKNLEIRCIELVHSLQRRLKKPEEVGAILKEIIVVVPREEFLAMMARNNMPNTDSSVVTIVGVTCTSET